MGRTISSGLRKRGKIWHIEKQIFGVRLRQSTYTEHAAEAQRYLARRIEMLRESILYGTRPQRVFKEAATKFLMENQHKRTIGHDAGLLKKLMPFIGHLNLEAIHRGSLEAFIVARKKDGLKNQSINHSLQLVGHILNLAASEWCDEQGLSWLKQAPKIKRLPEFDVRKPYPLSWEEQHRLFAELPPHLKNMALFTVNTGCRDQEVCRLRWAWELKHGDIPEELMIFVVPGVLVKNGQDRLIICNQTAKAVIEEQRRKHPHYVFAYRGKPLHHMLNHGWCAARKKVGLPVRVHDLKHTFGRRMRAAGVSFEDRQDLLGHKSSRITTHYSAPELQNLYQSANKVCGIESQGVSLTILGLKTQISTQNSHSEPIK
ncbi:MAG: site-specific integrase [Gammaproteobacteria bacterium]|nr:site-specific integrase [Gammaproteobacteria bacterium]MBP9728822.1 site-specific integrase [Gammaproteobacteria bacterium]